jgi:hypothetical protein
MPIEWQKSKQTKAPVSKVIEYYMNPKVHVEKAHPNLVDQVKILNSADDTVTWEQGFKMMGMSLHSVVKSSLNRATNTIETQSMAGAGRGTSMSRTFKTIPMGGTEINFIFRPNLGTLGFLLKGRAKKGFEETIKEDIQALDSMAGR